MRRLSAFLMVVALAAVLIPAATLAAKPPTLPDEITGIEWLSLQASGGLCDTQVNVHHTLGKGAPRTLRVCPVDGNGASPDCATVKADRRGATGVQFSLYLPNVPNPVKVSAWLYDKKGALLYGPVHTSTYSFSGCPVGLNLLGSYGSW